MKKTTILDAVVIVCGMAILYALLRHLRATLDGGERVFAYLVVICCTGFALKGIHYLIHGKAREKP